MQPHIPHYRRPPLIRSVALLLALTLSSLALPLARTATAAPTPPPNFQVTPVFTGLKNPTDFAFADDGRVFVAEKAGLVKVFDSLNDTTPTTFADLQTNVYKGPNDHGILGIALDPGFTANRPYVYILYTYDAPIGGTAPRWNDICNDPPGQDTNGCVVSGRLSRLQANGNLMTGNEQVLIEEWCQQFTSHSIGGLAFGQDGALYASAGEGANTSRGDYGHLGVTGVISPGTPFEKDYRPYPINPCGDPPVAIGELQQSPQAMGGALRAQSLSRPAGEARLLNGTIIRVSPDTGAGLPNNPRASSADANERRVVGYGLRNPFRFTIRPGTNEIWIGDVGWGRTEEIDRIPSPTASAIANFGWPCYEGASPQSAYNGMNLNVCESLYVEQDVTKQAVPPYYEYAHRTSMIPGDPCKETYACQSAITGLAFYTGGNYPATYDGALFFADYARHAIFVMSKGQNGLPAPAAVAPFITGLDRPVSLKVGPGGDLFFADLGGTIYRASYFAGNQPPIANLQAGPTSGAAPLAVSFDGSGSSDPDGDPLIYAWDLDGDGQYDDSSASQPGYTYTQNGSYTVRLKVTDDKGAFGTASTTITVGNTPPTAVIDTPSASMRWRVGDTIAFSGHASDAEQGALPSAALEWTIVLHHCYTPTDCHEHMVEDVSGSGGSFAAPDHEDLPYIELRLTATDAGGLSDTASVLLTPQTASLALRSNPTGLAITLDSEDVSTPHQQTVVAGSAHTLIAPEVQAHRSFMSWTDANTQTLRTILIGTAPTTYTATYANKPPVAKGSAAPSNGAAPLAVTFSAAWSSDPEGDSLTYRWEFGDGSTATTPNPTHIYATPGARQAKLTVTDWLGASHSVTIPVNVAGSSGGPRKVWLPLIRR
jgi:glucose/arabinose dehydrogenase/PKD repeat protein